MKIYRNLFQLLLVLLISSCGGANNTELHEDHVEAPTISHTVWTNTTELFVEYPPLIVGEQSRFAAHFSEMKHFKAIVEGQVTVSLIKDKTGIRNTVDAPSSPGIFKPILEPTHAGIFTLVFEIKTPTFEDRIEIENIEVFSSMDEAIHKLPTVEENPNEISFLKEQAWKMEFSNAAVIRDTIYEIIKTNGEILAAQGDEKTLTATSSGILIFREKELTVGSSISNGQQLFSISGKDITNDNIETEYLKSKSNYERSKSNFDRKEKLYESEAISKADYEEALLNYELAKSEFQNLSANFGSGGKSVKASANGYIKTLYKQEGDFVAIGDPIAVITKNQKLTIVAFVSQGDYSKLNNNMSANFSFNGEIYDITKLGGKLLSFGKSINKESARIPVYFELNNIGNLLAGSHIEVWIKTQPKMNGLLVPKAALLEEYGQYSVIVQTSGEGFEERKIQTGISDGKYVEVLSGLSEGERVVIKGAYQVKMASMSGQVPAHGHSH